MSITYNIDILEALKNKGYSTYKIRQEKILPESTLTSLRTGKSVSLENICKIASLLGCTVDSLVTYHEEKEV